MKNKKASSIILIFLITVFSVFAEVSLTEFSFAPEIGFLNGKIVENVWYVKVSNTDNTITFTPTTRMSRLDWQLDNSFFFGASTDFTFNDKYTVSFSFKNAVSGDCGIMEDYDWMNPITIGWENDPADEITNYSIHTNYLNNYTHINFLFGRIFYLGPKNNISLTPLFGLDIENTSFSGIGGWKTYKRDNWAKYNFEEGKKVISYSQSYIAPIVLLNSDFNFLKYLEACLNLSAVWINKLNCVDLHHAKGAYYNDRIENAWKLNAEAGLFFKINKSNKFGFKGTVTYIPDAYGFTYSSAESTTPDKTSIGGTSRFLWTYSFVYKIIF